MARFVAEERKQTVMDMARRKLNTLKEKDDVIMTVFEALIKAEDPSNYIAALGDLKLDFATKKMKYFNKRGHSVNVSVVADALSLPAKEVEACMKVLA
jgi:hypothetical protein